MCLYEECSALEEGEVGRVCASQVEVMGEVGTDQGIQSEHFGPPRVYDTWCKCGEHSE